VRYRYLICTSRILPFLLRCAATNECSCLPQLLLFQLWVQSFRSTVHLFAFSRSEAFENMALGKNNKFLGGQNTSKRRAQFVTASLFGAAILLLVYFTIPGQSSFGLPTHGSKHQQLAENPNLDALRSYGLSQGIQYTRCEMVVVHSKVSGATFSENLDFPLPEFHNINLDDASFAKPKPEVYSYPITVRAPKPRLGVDALHIVFGVATTLKRLDQSLSTFAHWAGGSKTKIYAVVEIQRDDVKAVQQKALALGFELEISESPADHNDRYFSLIKLLFEKGKNAHWAAIIDDDTFFPSMSNLVARLATYDSTQSHYVGGISEDFVRMGLRGYMAYGGAGIFISMPLLRQMNAVYEECCEARQWMGDGRIAHCIYKHTPTKLSVEHGLHQVDLHGDPSGFYESGRPQPLSVHRWRSWFNIDMTKLTAVASVCGDECLLQRWRFADGWYLTNGFSLVKYSHDIAADDISIEKTWDDYSTANDDAYSHALAPLRPKDEGKIIYRLEDAIIEGDKVRQFYVHRLSSGLGDRVVEVLWRLG
jgi:hypothetical protein